METSSRNLSSPETAAHIDTLIAQEGGAVEVAPDAAFVVDAAPVLIGKEEFTRLFISGFNIAHIATRFNSLKITPEKEGSATACAEALHETIMDCPSLHWMLSPSGKWTKRVLAIGMFTVPMAIATAEEIAQRRGQRATPAPQPTTAAAATSGEGPTPDQLKALGAA